MIWIGLAAGLALLFGLLTITMRVDQVIVGLAILARLAGRIGIPTIPLYLLAGLAFGEGGVVPLVVADAGARFLGGLEGVADPEAKRKGIGRTFIDVFEAEATRLGGGGFLPPGTAPVLLHI